MARIDRYLSGKEIRAIARENKKDMKRLEAYKYRKANESEYLTRMKDNKNLLDIDELNTYFFTEQGVAFKERNLCTQFCCVSRGKHTGGTAADDCDFSFVHIDIHAFL